MQYILSDMYGSIGRKNNSAVFTASGTKSGWGTFFYEAFLP